jgi:hypothetical protein
VRAFLFTSVVFADYIVIFAYRFKLTINNMAGKKGEIDGYMIIVATGTIFTVLIIAFKEIYNFL